MSTQHASFTKLLLQWNKEQNTRKMPWKGEKNPYFIWLSEIILQQTRVEQGLPYYLAFRGKYPKVGDLALANGEDVMRLWQGLGYYSRARNLHETAKNVHFNMNGVFPKTFNELKKLKGVGDYTAAAIASFAYNEPVAVVDGNVIRVLSRVFGIDTPFDTTTGKSLFARLAQQLIDVTEAGAYNQAIMDLGATVCTPQNPLCNQCPLCKICIAFKDGRIEALPVRQNRTAVKNRYFNYIVIKKDDKIIINKRTGKDIWKDLYEFPLIETEKQLTRNFAPLIENQFGLKNVVIKSYSKDFVQLLTHRKIHSRFIEIELKNMKSFPLNGAQIVALKDLQNFAFPKTVHLYLSQNCLL